MASAQNRVIAGAYKGKAIEYSLTLPTLAIVLERTEFWNTPKTVVYLNKNNVVQYELITDEHRKSAASGIARGLVGGALLGPVGLLAGLSAKSKGIYTVAIELRGGERSLIEIDDKLYKMLISNCF